MSLTQQEINLLANNDSVQIIEKAIYVKDWLEGQGYTENVIQDQAYRTLSNHLQSKLKIRDKHTLSNKVNVVVRGYNTILSNLG